MASLRLMEAEYILMESRTAEHQDAIDKLEKRMVSKGEQIVSAGGEIPTPEVNDPDD